MTNIRIIEKPVIASVVEMLEACLDRAKSGDVLGIVVIQSFNDNCTNHVWAGVAQNSVRITGELMIAATSIAGHIDNDRFGG